MPGKSTSPSAAATSAGWWKKPASGRRKPTGTGNTTQQDQAIANLLSNAVKYSAPPDPVDISADVEGPWVRLRVCDRGVGIPEEERPKLFERFFRAKTAAGVEGTGIGLHFTRTIARMHGGDVEAQPREGGGSSFILSIPIEDPAT